MTLGVNREERFAAVAKCSLFHGLDRLAQERIAVLATSRRYPPGSTLFSRGEAGGPLLLIESGMVCLSLFSDEGKELVVDIAGRGDTVGELSFADGDRRETSCIALESVRVVSIARHGLPMSVESNLNDYLSALLYRRLRETVVLIEELALCSLEARLIRRLQHFDKRTSVRLSRLGQGVLAMLVNASRPKLNRQLHRLQKVGVIDLNKGAIVEVHNI